MTPHFFLSASVFPNVTLTSIEGSRDQALSTGCLVLLLGSLLSSQPGHDKFSCLQCAVIMDTEF